VKATIKFAGLSSYLLTGCKQ